jgi:O-antigen ligase
VIAIVALVRPTTVSSLTSFVVYKNGSRDILASRISPWQEAADNIRDHPWFGMGLGTTNANAVPDQDDPAVTMSSGATAEHGSSYLAIVAGVGIVGTIPAAILLLVLVTKVVRVLRSVYSLRSVAHPATMLAIVMISGIIHASFEDWMFAPGSYLCVFFWSLAFVFNDLVTPLPRVDFNWNLRATGAAALSRP